MKGFLISLAVIISLIWVASISSSQPDSATQSGLTQSAPTEQEFDGYSCTDDCSGHQAGYDWAAENDVCEPDYDGGNSESFAEGVRAYAQDGC